MMVGTNLKDTQLQQIVDKTIILYDKVSSWQPSQEARYDVMTFQDNDGKISFDEFCQVVKNTDIHTRMVVEV